MRRGAGPTARRSAPRDRARLRSPGDHTIERKSKGPRHEGSYAVLADHPGLGTQSEGEEVTCDANVRLGRPFRASASLPHTSGSISHASG
jgi:hypothetical protein